ncbi:hypothetical protein EDB19DRAFT_1917787 [Suillus lakei]|nr:hypothetical protein EDB19DRAFT_1917787 [Suillus lakei]
MQLNNALEATEKHVIKLTGKAKAALEDKASSKKHKPDGSGDNVNLLLKKAKKNLPASGMTLADKDRPGTALLLSPSPTPPPVMSRCAVMCMEEENMLHECIDLDDDEPANSDSDAQLQVYDADESPQDELKWLMKEWNLPVYIFFDLTPQIVEITD